MREPLSYAVAVAAAEAVIEAARAENLRICVAVVHRGGATKVLLSDDGVGPIGVETARRKAYTAAVTGTSTDRFAALAAGPAMAAAPPHLVDPQLLAVAGGEPLVVDAGEVIGGIGVGGADGATDQRLAAHGCAAVTSMLDR